MVHSTHRPKFHLISLLVGMVIFAGMLGTIFIKIPSSAHSIDYGWPLPNLSTHYSEYNWSIRCMLFNGLALALSAPITILFIETFLRRHEDRYRARSMMSFLLLFPLTYLPIIFLMWASKYNKPGELVNWVYFYCFMGSLYGHSLIAWLSVYWGIRSKLSGGRFCKWIILAGLIGSVVFCFTVWLHLQQL